MSGITFARAQRAVTSIASAFPTMPKKAIASTLLGTLGIIYSIAMRNKTYFAGAILWTAASYALGYFTKNKSVRVHAPNILDHSRIKKMSVKDFQTQVKALYEERLQASPTTFDQRKKFYALMSASYLFPASERMQLSFSLNTLNMLRPYMEMSLFLPAKYVKKLNIPTPALSLDILRHRDFVRLEALEEFEKYGKIPLNGDRFSTAIERVFAMIDKGILEDPTVQEEWVTKRGDSQSFQFGEDDAYLYFQRKFFVKSYTTGLCALTTDKSNPWARFCGVTPIRSSVSYIRSSDY